MHSEKSPIKLQGSAKLRYSIAYLLIAGLLQVYFLKNYETESRVITGVTCYSNIHDILIYPLECDGPGFDYALPVRPKLTDSLYSFDLTHLQLRNIRLHFGQSSDKGQLRKLKLHYGNETELVSATDVLTNGVSLKKGVPGTLFSFSCESNGFIELRKSHITASEFSIGESLIFLLSGLILFLIHCVLPVNLRGFEEFFNIKTASVALFLFSIFLPQPVFNISLIFSFLLVIRNFDHRRFTTNTTGLLFVIYFLYFIFNSLFISEQFNRSLFETLLPFLLLPFYFACVPRANYLQIFPLSAVCLGLYFISAACLNTYLFKSLSYFSFDMFTLKYLHPVYFSYLLFFSLVYLEFHTHVFNKKVVLPVIIFCMICCASKLIIVLTFLFYLSIFVRRRKYVGYVFIVIGVAGLIAFAPTRKRFLEIVELKNISILNEPVIRSYHDSRLNGLTLRLLLWQESMHAVNTPKTVLFGNGVDKRAELLLEHRLTKRGLESGHTKYDPHNQFISTYYKMGAIGLFILLCICTYAFIRSFITANKILGYATLLFMAGMFTESVLQRIVGINFFISILLLLSGIFFSQQYLENSDPRNKGNTQ